MKDTEMNSMTYEYFMNRAYKLDQRLRRPNKAEFKHLVEMEVNNEDLSKTLNELKLRLQKACEIFLKQDLPKVEQNRIGILQSLIANAKTSQNIYECAARGLVMTDRFI